MARLVHVVSFCIALHLAPACFAQSWPADLTIVSVLTMAKDVAETEPANPSRLLLEEKVARAKPVTNYQKDRFAVSTPMAHILGVVSRVRGYHVSKCPTSRLDVREPAACHHWARQLKRCLLVSK
jgi:hypothetical protein